jgi:hypothetical protein
MATCMHTRERRTQHRKPHRVVGCDDQLEAGEGQTGRFGVGIHGAVPVFGALRFIVRSFNAQAPLGERGVVIGFETFSRTHGRFKTPRFNCVEKRLCDRSVNLQAADIETVDAAAILDPFVRAMVAGCLVGSAIVSLKEGLHRWCRIELPNRPTTATIVE